MSLGRVDFHLHSYASNVTDYYTANLLALPESYSDPIETYHELKRQGMSVLIISHNLDQIFRITSGIWVLRRGRAIGYRETARTRPEEVVHMITGAPTIAGAG